MVPKICLFQLFLLPTSPPCPFYWNYVLYHIFHITRRIIWFLGFSLYQWTGISSKSKSRSHQPLPVACPFLECCPLGLDQPTKIAWKLCLAQPPVHFIFTLFLFPFELWVILWKGGNHGKGLEAAILGHHVSGVCIIQNLSFYTCLQFTLLPWL